MEKPEVCEWSDCQEKPKTYVILDNEKYWFCSHEHADEFWDSIKENY
jgi:hypothetical protein